MSGSRTRSLLLASFETRHSSMYEMKKFVGLLLLPNTLFFLLLAVGVLLLWFSSRRRLAQTLVTLAFGGYLLMGYNSNWNFLVERLEYQYPVFDAKEHDLKDVRWIVVLGGGGEESEVLPAP